MGPWEEQRLPCDIGVYGLSLGQSPGDLGQGAGCPRAQDGRRRRDKDRLGLAPATGTRWARGDRRQLPGAGGRPRVRAVGAEPGASRRAPGRREKAEPERGRIRRKLAAGAQTLEFLPETLNRLLTVLHEPNKPAGEARKDQGRACERNKKIAAEISEFTQPLWRRTLQQLKQKNGWVSTKLADATKCPVSGQEAV